ncbi:MAG: Na/Pi cotransporter family protein [Bacteroidetes bacterium]|nr:MAG: Na/Pi cotransporter family protein [Bacteroidota bacterium]
MSEILTKSSFDKFLGRYYAVFGMFIILSIAIYTFFIALGLLQITCKPVLQFFLNDIVNAISNPFVALFVGLLATAIVQSSSLTTSIAVIMVAENLISLQHAVPLIMGANIGTSLTSTFTSLAYMNNRYEFKDAISAATIHDFFNILTTFILFPLEYYFHILSNTAGNLTHFLLSLPLFEPSFHYEWEITKIVTHWIANNLPNQVILLTLSIVLMLISIKVFAVYTKQFLAKKEDSGLTNRIFRNSYQSLLAGFLLTAIARSSSVMSSVTVPLVVSKKVSLEKYFPFIMGVNVGTTVTAVLVSMGKSDIAISLAFAHLAFNVFGILIFFPIQKLRQIPIYLSKKLGEMVMKNQLYGLLYILLIFFLLPFLLIYFSK